MSRPPGPSNVIKDKSRYDSYYDTSPFFILSRVCPAHRHCTALSLGSLVELGDIRAIDKWIESAAAQCPSKRGRLPLRHELELCSVLVELEELRKIGVGDARIAAAAKALADSIALHGVEIPRVNIRALAEAVESKRERGGGRVSTTRGDSSLAAARAWVEGLPLEGSSVLATGEFHPNPAYLLRHTFVSGGAAPTRFDFRGRLYHLVKKMPPPFDVAVRDALARRWILLPKDVQARRSSRPTTQSHNYSPLVARLARNGLLFRPRGLGALSETRGVDLSLLLPFGRCSRLHRHVVKYLDEYGCRSALDAYSAWYGLHAVSAAELGVPSARAQPLGPTRDLVGFFLLSDSLAALAAAMALPSANRSRSAARGVLSFLPKELWTRLEGAAGMGGAADDQDGGGGAVAGSRGIATLLEVLQTPEIAAQYGAYGEAYGDDSKTSNPIEQKNRNKERKRMRGAQQNAIRTATVDLQCSFGRWRGSRRRGSISLHELLEMLWPSLPGVSVEGDGMGLQGFFQRSPVAIALERTAAAPGSLASAHTPLITQMLTAGMSTRVLCAPLDGGSPGVSPESLEPSLLGASPQGVHGVVAAAVRLVLQNAGVSRELEGRYKPHSPLSCVLKESVNAARSCLVLLDTARRDHLWKNVPESGPPPAILCDILLHAARVLLVSGVSGDVGAIADAAFVSGTHRLRKLWSPSCDERPVRLAQLESESPDLHRMFMLLRDASSARRRRTIEEQQQMACTIVAMHALYHVQLDDPTLIHAVHQLYGDEPALDGEGLDQGRGPIAPNEQGPALRGRALECFMFVAEACRLPISMVVTRFFHFVHTRGENGADKEDADTGGLDKVELVGEVPDTATPGGDQHFGERSHKEAVSTSMELPDRTLLVLRTIANEAKQGRASKVNAGYAALRRALQNPNHYAQSSLLPLLAAQLGARRSDCFIVWVLLQMSGPPAWRVVRHTIAVGRRKGLAIHATPNAPPVAAGTGDRIIFANDAEAQVIQGECASSDPISALDMGSLVTGVLQSHAPQRSGTLDGGTLGSGTLGSGTSRVSRETTSGSSHDEIDETDERAATVWLKHKHGFSLVSKGGVRYMEPVPQLAIEACAAARWEAAAAVSMSTGRVHHRGRTPSIFAPPFDFYSVLTRACHQGCARMLLEGCELFYPASPLVYALRFVIRFSQRRFFESETHLERLVAATTSGSDSQMQDLTDATAADHENEVLVGIVARAAALVDLIDGKSTTKNRPRNVDAVGAPSPLAVASRALAEAIAAARQQGLLSISRNAPQWPPIPSARAGRAQWQAWRSAAQAPLSAARARLGTRARAVAQLRHTRWEQAATFHILRSCLCRLEIPGDYIMLKAQLDGAGYQFAEKLGLFFGLPKAAEVPTSAATALALDQRAGRDGHGDAFPVGPAADIRETATRLFAGDMSVKEATRRGFDTVAPFACESSGVSVGVAGAQAATASKTSMGSESITDQASAPPGQAEIDSALSEAIVLAGLELRAMQREPRERTGGLVHLGRVQQVEERRLLLIESYSAALSAGAGARALGALFFNFYVIFSPVFSSEAEHIRFLYPAYLFWSGGDGTSSGRRENKTTNAVVDPELLAEVRARLDLLFVTSDLGEVSVPLLDSRELSKVTPVKVTRASLGPTPLRPADLTADLRGLWQLECLDTSGRESKTMWKNKSRKLDAGFFVSVIEHLMELCRFPIVCRVIERAGELGALRPQSDNDDRFDYDGCDHHWPSMERIARCLNRVSVALYAAGMDYSTEKLSSTLNDVDIRQFRKSLDFDPARSVRVLSRAALTSDGALAAAGKVDMSLKTRWVAGNTGGAPSAAEIEAGSGAAAGVTRLEAQSRFSLALSPLESEQLAGILCGPTPKSPGGSQRAVVERLRQLWGPGDTTFIGRFLAMLSTALVAGDLSPDTSAAGIMSLLCECVPVRVGGALAPLLRLAEAQQLYLDRVVRFRPARVIQGLALSNRFAALSRYLRSAVFWRRPDGHAGVPLADHKTARSRAPPLPLEYVHFSNPVSTLLDSVLHEGDAASQLMGWRTEQWRGFAAAVTNASSWLAKSLAAACGDRAKVDAQQTAEQAALAKQGDVKVLQEKADRTLRAFLCAYFLFSSLGVVTLSPDQGGVAGTLSGLLTWCGRLKATSAISATVAVRVLRQALATTGEEVTLRAALLSAEQRLGVVDLPGGFRESLVRARGREGGLRTARSALFAEVRETLLDCDGYDLLVRLARLLVRSRRLHAALQHARLHRQALAAIQMFRLLAIELQYTHLRVRRFNWLDPDEADLEDIWARYAGRTTDGARAGRVSLEALRSMVRDAFLAKMSNDFVRETIGAWGGEQDRFESSGAALVGNRAADGKGGAQLKPPQELFYNWKHTCGNAVRQFEGRLSPEQRARGVSKLELFALLADRDFNGAHTGVSRLAGRDGAAPPVQEANVYRQVPHFRVVFCLTDPLSGETQLGVAKTDRALARQCREVLATTALEEDLRIWDQCYAKTGEKSAGDDKTPWRNLGGAHGRFEEEQQEEDI